MAKFQDVVAFIRYVMSLCGLVEWLRLLCREFVGNTSRGVRKPDETTINNSGNNECSYHKPTTANTSFTISTIDANADERQNLKLEVVLGDDGQGVPKHCDGTECKCNREKSTIYFVACIFSVTMILIISVLLLPMTWDKHRRNIYDRLLRNA